MVIKTKAKEYFRTSVSIFFKVTKNYYFGQNTQDFSVFVGSHYLWALRCLFFVSKVIASVMLLLIDSRD